MNTVQELMQAHNSLVNERYIVTNPDSMISWLHVAANYSDQYIEISSNEALSGHAEILDLSYYMHLLD